MAMGKLENNFTIRFGNGNKTHGIDQIDHSPVTLMSCRVSVDKQEKGFNSTPINTKDYAVLVKHIEYSHKKSKQKVLNCLSMRIPKGSIYGLTGSSGSGKSTLISCILGTRSVNSGAIFLYGYSHNDPNRQTMVDIPGKGVGFMPQELALYSKFTVKEILFFFGRLYGMSMDDIEHSTQKLLDLLQLSRTSTRIESMSGGEKRRVSFAVSLIHAPKLLVLDEPTVGMDPLLRLRIWSHLRSLVKERQVTVLITSHYLDEMRKADIVGVMREGKIIVENSPEALLSLCKADSLDDVVLNLCKNTDLIPVLRQTPEQERKVCYQNASATWSFQKRHKQHLSQLRESIFRIRAVIRKNLFTLLRNIPLLIFVMCIPASQLLIVLMFGYEPTQIRLGVVNEELNIFPSTTVNDSFLSAPKCPEFLEDTYRSCELNLLSCRFLSHISALKVNLVNFNYEHEAEEAVTKGNIYGYLGFGQNFSSRLVDRALKPTEIDFVDIDITESHITARFDQSNTIIYRLLLKELYQSQEAFLTSLLSACGANPKFGEYPLQYRKPVFGIADDFNFSNSLAPGSTIPFMFFFSIISSGLRFVEERNCGILERMLIAGVKLSEIMISFLVSELLIIAAQSSLIFALLSWWIPLHNTELLSFCIAFLLMILAGYTGVSMGFFVGSLCTEQVQVAIIAVAFVLPNIILAGLIWPLEGMSVIMQTFVQFLPCNLSSKAVSSIWSRGLGITHPNVWPGVLILIAYTLILNLLTVLYHATVKK